MRRTITEAMRLNGKKVHPHPATILTNSLKQVLLLAIPIVRALFSSFGDFAEWSDYLWVDLLALVFMFLLGTLLYLTTWYRYEGQGIFYRVGIFVRRQGFIPFDELSAVISERPFYARPFGICKLYLDTDAGGGTKEEFSISIAKKDAEEFAKRYGQTIIQSSAVSRKSQALWWEVLILSAISSDSVSGLLFFAAAISGLGDSFTEDLEKILRTNFNQMVQLATLLKLRIPPVVAWVVYLLLVTWLISFFTHVLRTLRFTAIRRGDVLVIKSGVINLYDNLLRVPKINRISLRQSILTWLFDIESVFVQCCGYGKFNYNLAVLLPAGTKKRIRAQMKLLLPEVHYTKRQIKPRGVFFTRFLIYPMWELVGLIGVWILLPKLLPAWQETISFGCGALLFWILWYLAVRVIAYFHDGVGYEDGAYTLYYTKGLGIYTTYLPVHKITRIEIYQTIFQKFTGGCDVFLDTRNEHQSRIRIPNMHLEDAKQMFGVAAHYDK